VIESRRFAFVTPNYHPRVCGVGDFSAHFAAELMRRGHEVAIFSRDPVGRNPQEQAVEAHGVPGRLPLVIARNVISALREYRPTDVLLQYTSQMWDAGRLGSVAPLAVASQARRAGARVTVVGHELFLAFQRRPDLFLGAATQRLQLAALLGLCDRVFVTTGTRAQLISTAAWALTGHGAGIVRVGPSALPAERWRPRDPARPRLGVFSTASPGKRHDLVLDSFALVAHEMPEAELVLIGDLGPAERPHVKQVLEQVARHPAKDRIRLTGALPLEAIAREIADLDLYLAPMDTGANTRSSTLPTALGSALPTIAGIGEDTDLDLFRDGENVVLVPDMTAPAFAEAALRLLRDEGAMARIGAGARRLYDENLSWARIVDRFLGDQAVGGRA
jgi:glycosyltransferase involved in cell wall biosynthesis